MSNMSPQKIKDKKNKEKRIVNKMITIYCKGNHQKTYVPVVNNLAIMWIRE